MKEEIYNFFFRVCVFCEVKIETSTQLQDIEPSAEKIVESDE